MKEMENKSEARALVRRIIQAPAIELFFLLLYYE